MLRCFRVQLHWLTFSGTIATKFPTTRGLKTIKKEILKLVGVYVAQADDLDMVHKQLVPKLLETILLDYKQNIPDAREPEVMNVMTAIINKLNVRWRPISSKLYMVRLALRACTSELTVCRA